MEALFWISLFGAVYSYFLYPVVLLALRPWQAASGTHDAHEPAHWPAVSLIVTAHNEAGRIQEKLRNALAIDYPFLEIIVASDCSTDATDALVNEFSGQGVRLVRAPERKGKEFAQLCAIQAATGSILVFSDTGTSIEPDSLRKLVRHFDDPGVGAVSSEDRFFRDDGALVGEGAYVRYEMWLRQLEAELGGLVGLSGSFFAARQEVCMDWDIEAPSDFNTALNCAKRGLRAVSAPDVLGYYKDLKDPSREYQRKVRTILRGITGLLRHLEVLDPRMNALFAWQVLSHKVMRWLVPVFLALLFLSSLALHSTHWFYFLAVAGQSGFYLTALAAHAIPTVRQVAPVRIIYFFCQANVAIAQAAAQYFSGTRMTTWQPSAR